jgi:hypothetical protein
MKKLIAVMALALSVSAFAADHKVSFSHGGMNGWGQSYYSCDYAEAQTEKVLALFGAQNAEVTCSGGIQYGQMWPVSVTASWDAPALSGREVAEVVKLKGDTWNPSCGLNVAIVKNLVSHFANVTVVKKSDSCAFANSNYSYEFSIVR